jgi:hypothetical protein
VQFVINTYDDSKTSISPYIATFGSAAADHILFLGPPVAGSMAPYLRKLDEDLKQVRAVIKDHQE